jgi:adenosylhomocysteine nucleosidase
MTSTTIAFICAMPMELRPLVKRLELEKEEIGGVPVRSGSLDGRAVVAIATGMGTTLATGSTERLLTATTPARVLVFGITGAVDDEIAIGAMVNPELVVNSETGTEHRPQQITGATPHGIMWTTNVITPADELPALRAKGVISLDMETAAIAECCERRDIPWSVHRAISDRATDGSVDDEVFKLSHQDGTPNPRAVARYFLRHPQRIPGMAKMAKGAKLATDRAADAVIEAARQLSS